MNDPLKYETRHLLFEVGDYVTFYYFIVIMNRWKQYEEFWTLILSYNNPLHILLLDVAFLRAKSFKQLFAYLICKVVLWPVAKANKILNISGQKTSILMMIF